MEKKDEFDEESQRCLLFVSLSANGDSKHGKCSLLVPKIHQCLSKTTSTSNSFHMCVFSMDPALNGVHETIVLLNRSSWSIIWIGKQ